MKSYILITGNLNGIDEFEDKISSALDDGYEICNNLIMRDHVDPDSGSNGVLLAQAMILEDFEDDEEFDEIEFEDEVEYDEKALQ